MEANVVAVAFVLLLLTLGTNALSATADLVTRNDGGEPPASRKDDFGVSAYAVNWSPPASQEKDFGVSAYAVNWSPSGKKENDFGVSSYAVNWSPSAKKEDDDFGVSAYAVNWSPPAKKDDEFGVSSYAVNWSPPAKKEDADFGVSAYAVNWSPSALTKEKDFAESSYAVNWNDEDSAPSPKDFAESSYTVNWNDEDSAPSPKGFAESSYAVNWNDEDSGPSPRSFAESSYAVNWNDEDSAPSPKGFAASSYAVNRKDEDSAPSHSPAPKAPARHHHIRVQTGMLFLKKNLHIGTVLPEGTTFARAGVPKSDSSVSTPLEPKYLETILSQFKIPRNSMKASQVADTLRSCGKPAGDKQEEPRMCFSSRDAMARFAAKALGVSCPVRAAITRIHGQETPSSSRYVVEKIAQLSNDMVPCHPMDFPYEVFYCHRPKEVQAFTVQLKDENNGVPQVATTAMCHMNTSNWDEQYFELLGGVRGEPICHYMPQNYIMFY